MMQGFQAQANYAAAAKQSAYAGYQAASHRRLTAERNYNTLLDKSHQAIHMATWQTEYAQQKAAQIQQLASMRTSAALQMRDMALEAAGDVRVEAGTVASEITAETEVEANLIYREKLIVEEMRQEDIRNSYKQEGKVGSAVVMKNAASGIDPLSGTSVDELLEAAYEFSEQRAAINFENFTQQETIELRSEQTLRQGILNANKVIRQGYLVAKEYENQARKHEIDAKTSWYEGQVAVQDTLYEGQLAAYQSRQEAFEYTREAENEVYYAELDAQRYTYGGQQAAAGYAAKSQAAGMSAIGAGISGVSNVVSTYNRYQATRPQGVQSGYSSYSGPSANWFGAGSGSGAW